MANSEFDDYAREYNEFLKQSISVYGSDISYYARHKSIVISQNTKMEPKTIIDFGCGIGRNIPFLKYYFPDSKVSGYDISNESLDIAREENPETEFFGESRLAEFSGTADIILIACVFHHIPPSQRLDVMESARSLLSDKGEIFVFEHNPYNPLTLHAVKKCPLDADATLLKPAEVRALLREAHLSIEKQEYTLYFPAAWKKFQPMERMLRILPIGGQYFFKARL